MNQLKTKITVATSFLTATLLLSACAPEKSAIEADSQASTKSEQESRFNGLEQDVENILTQLTLEEKISLVHASGKFHVDAIERLGVPELWLSDGPHGVRHQIEKYSWSSAEWDDDQSTYLPHLTSVAASWDLNMATMHGNVLGSEARHRGKDIILGPGVNLARLPLYGRNFEYMGEDPVLAAKLVVPEVKAIQSHDVAANAKHYALNTQELNRIGVNAKPDERTLREVYLPVFESAVKDGGVYSIMGAYNQYYGTNANQSKHLVMDILKGEWGFDGVLLTDWNVDINTRDAALHGLDLEMGTNVDSYDDYFLAKPFLEEIKAGNIPVAVLDDKVRRVLRLMHRVGLFDENRLPGARNTKEHQQAARTIGANGVVLLKNQDNVLPWDKSKIKNILVLGPNANKKHGQGGGSSEVKSLYEVTPLEGLKNEFGEQVNITVMRARSNELSPIAADYVASRHWTGTPAWNVSYFNDAKHTELTSENWIVNSEFKSTIADKNDFITMKADIKPLKTGEHILKLNSDGNIKVSVNGEAVLSFDGKTNEQLTYPINLTADQVYKFEIEYAGNKEFVLGWDAPGNLFSTVEEYTTAAKQADAVIYFGGLSHGDDREAIDRPDMKLPNSQDEIITNLLNANANTVVFMVAGSAVEMPWAEQAKAVVWGWYGGQEAGNAFADILVGDVNPSGKMPITLPAKLEHTAPIALNDYNAVESLYSEGVFIGYRWFEQQNIKPTFEFGYGLSYTNFGYSDIKLSNDVFNGEGQLVVTANVINTGKVAGAEVVQLYLNDEVASVERPAKELKGFDKVFLEPGETKQVTIALNKRDLSFWDVNSNDWLAEEGNFNVLLGASLSDIRLQKQFTYKTQ
ncbi:glycoside hydrolase family 3 C-terminal domain-containing protein [Thalassomonas sp. M1454]|uniref:glycoside hydrolase family 3 C-terminal domain-containing protein n=1 Tax=Thalassomonas sp. M1454 TaxID=2594477 RepID=UPI00117C0BE1|nr:glycoside hydrolase family 3 C-terminal domain-containing protein [Thalassomonas sp. M1454]TRX53483.1 glycosyl hydrolase [Thalassomonas sp. M1454]